MKATKEWSDRESKNSRDKTQPHVRENTTTTAFKKRKEEQKKHENTPPEENKNQTENLETHPHTM